MTFPQQDLPGFNITLRPEAAPQWLKGVIDHPRSIHRRLEGTMQERTLPANPSRAAAVLMLLSGSAGSASGSTPEALPDDAAVLLTHRSPSLRSHSGQIAFPGGRIDPGDTNVVDAALREAWEETGLDRRAVVPLAQLDAVEIRVSGNPVHPVVGYWDASADVGVIDPGEADDVFLTPLAELVDPRNRVRLVMGPWMGPGFWVRDYLVWGFTGGLLSALFTQAGWERPWADAPVMGLDEAIARSRNNEPHYWGAEPRG